MEFDAGKGYCSRESVAAVMMFGVDMADQWFTSTRTRLPSPPFQGKLNRQRAGVPLGIRQEAMLQAS
jgi:hypothetical protein